MIKKFIRYWLPVLLWCGVIFYLSGIPNLKTELGVLDLILRKIAHITEYAILFLLSRRALESSWYLNNKGVYIAAILFSVMYAVSDEFHQSFVPGRGPAAMDVGIDSFGVLLGLLSHKFYGKKS